MNPLLSALIFIEAHETDNTKHSSVEQHSIQFSLSDAQNNFCPVLLKIDLKFYKYKKITIIQIIGLFELINKKINGLFELIFMADS